MENSNGYCLYGILAALYCALGFLLLHYSYDTAQSQLTRQLNFFSATFVAVIGTILFSLRIILIPHHHFNYNCQQATLEILATLLFGCWMTFHLKFSNKG